MRCIQLLPLLLAVGAPHFSTFSSNFQTLMFLVLTWIKEVVEQGHYGI